MYVSINVNSSVIHAVSNRRSITSWTSLVNISLHQHQLDVISVVGRWLHLVCQCDISVFKWSIIITLPGLHIIWKKSLFLQVYIYLKLLSNSHSLVICEWSHQCLIDNISFLLSNDLSSLYWLICSASSYNSVVL